MAAVGYTSGDPRKVDVAGDTMTGPLVLPGDPTAALDAAPKQYVDAATGGGGETVEGAQAKADAALAEAQSTSAQTAANLGDLTNQSVARDNLGLTGVVLLEVGETAGTVAAGDDWRFADPRVPQAHAWTHAPGGDDALENLSATNFEPGSVDGDAGVAGLRTLGTGAGQAAAGDHTHG